MLRTTKDLEHYAIGATDGDIGRVKDFYFDDDAWVVRYLVVDTGAWLLGRRVLISSSGSSGGLFGGAEPGRPAKPTSSSLHVSLRQCQQI